MLDNFTIINIDESGNVILQLSNYAAWAILRRLQGDEATGPIEQEFVDDAAERLADTLS